jgi:hypothetical protein
MGFEHESQFTGDASGFNDASIAAINNSVSNSEIIFLLLVISFQAKDNL